MGKEEKNQPSQLEEKYLKRQLYYFTPFVRKLYEATRTGLIGNPEANPIILGNIKDLSIYYAQAYILGAFNLKKEQANIDNIFQTIDNHLNIDFTDLKTKLLSISENRFCATDGELRANFFGQQNCQALIKTLPSSTEKIERQVGFLSLNQEMAKNITTKLTYYIQTEQTNHQSLSPVSIWGNVARGIFDAACIYVTLQKAQIDSSYHLFRMSPIAFEDKTAITIAEPTSMQGWVIGADSFSAGGTSVTGAIELLSKLNGEATSIFLSYGGCFWENRLSREFCYDPRDDFGKMFRVKNN